MKNGKITFRTLYDIMRDYFTAALPHPVQKSLQTLSMHLEKCNSGFKVTGPGLMVTVKAQPTAKIDFALVKDESAAALDSDIVAMLRWLKENGYLELELSGNAFYLATDKMLQTKTLSI